eukprot:3429887-Amphidinium_carterae.1
MHYNEKIDYWDSTTVCRSYNCDEFQDAADDSTIFSRNKLYAIGTTVNDVIYVRNFVYELNYIDNAAALQPQIYTDSSSAKCLTQQLGLTKITKHIDMRYLHVQKLQSDGELKIHK